MSSYSDSYDIEYIERELNRPSLQWTFEMSVTDLFTYWLIYNSIDWWWLHKVNAIIKSSDYTTDIIKNKQYLIFVLNHESIEFGRSIIRWPMSRIPNVNSARHRWMVNDGKNVNIDWHNIEPAGNHILQLIIFTPSISRPKCISTWR